MDLDSLWRDVDPSVISPPTATREQTLPFVNLSWENFERLCFRLAWRGGDVEDARIYGERGQAQKGIDLYVRRTIGDYETWQCKCYERIRTKDIERAVTKFLDGDWSKSTKLFRLAVAPSLKDTKLVKEIEKQRSRCEALNITFEPLDCDRLSLLLKKHPDLVDDFFGRPWVESFNGPEASSALSGRKLTREKKLMARRFLQTLYATQSKTVDGGIPAAARVFSGSIERVPVFERYVEPDVELVEFVVEQRTPPSASDSDVSSALASSASAPASPFTGFRRREVRRKVALSSSLGSCDRFILLGEAGFGKSAALRVLIHSLLGEEVKYPIIQTWAQKLPLLIPFGFLTNHFANNNVATIEGALQVWLKTLGAKNEGLALLDEMLADERLLLLIDGLDEWQNREAAVTTLTALTTFAQTRNLPLVATGRPKGLERISDFGPDWKRASLLPLTSNQQRTFATYWFRHFHFTAKCLAPDALELAVTRDATEFANELSQDSALSELCGVPLLLSVMIYLRLSGRVLPHSRLNALEELVNALLEDQPRRRSQAAMQCVDQSHARSPNIRRGIEYLAYRIHQEPNSIALPKEEAAHLLHGYFRKDIGLTVSEAEDWAGRVLELGQHEFGLIIPVQDKHVGFLHRIFQEYLVAKYISGLPLDRVKNYCAESGSKSQWREVTLLLLQLLQRQNEVDLLIEEIRKPVSDCLDEPGQKILLTQIAVADTNCSHAKARELISEVFSWIECGRWMSLRLALVSEVAIGLQSEKISSIVAARASRWFPGRTRWLHAIPEAAAKLPTSNTVTDLWIALHNCDSSYESRGIAEALATFANSCPELAEKLLEILRESAEPRVMAAALLALEMGWPMHSDLPILLKVSSAVGAKELRIVAILARFKRGEHSAEIRDVLVSFCLEGQRSWPWNKDIVRALATGWPHDPTLKCDALKRMKGTGFPGYWNWNAAIDYLLQGCPGDADVASMLAEKLTEEDDRESLIIEDVHEYLLANFSAHPLLVSAAEAWLDQNALSGHSPMEIAVIAKLGGTAKCRQALLSRLRHGKSMPSWIISTLLEMTSSDDPELQEVLAVYICDAQRRSEAVRWLPSIVKEPKDLIVMLHEVLNGKDIWNSCSALKILVDKAGRDSPELWSIVEAKLEGDNGGRYWRHGHRELLKIWPEHPSIRRLAKSNIYEEDISLPSLYEAYGGDPEIRSLLDQTLQVLHEDLRLELIRAVEPLARRGVPLALNLTAEFRNEPDGVVRTVAARSYARGCALTGRRVDDLVDNLKADLSLFGIYSEQHQQAAVAALLELDRADLVARHREDGRPLEISSYSGSTPNWEFIITLVEHWDALASAVPDIWERLKHCPVIAAELAKAGKGAQAMSQIQVFENAVRTGKQIDVEDIRALIALHGRSTLLRDLFIVRLRHFLTGHQLSMVVIEAAAYQEMASYVSSNFHGDIVVGQAMIEVAASPMVGHVGIIALCQGWPDSPPIASAAAKLSNWIDGGEPTSAWLFATKADAALMTTYVMHYPTKLRARHFGDSRQGMEAVWARLRSDRECQENIFARLKEVTDPDIKVAVTKLLAPALRNDALFRDWISNELRLIKVSKEVLAPLAFDVVANAYRPVEFSLLEAALT